MNITRCFLAFFLGVSVWASSAQAQYLPDTSLTYTGFLKQAQDFHRSPQQSAWVVLFWASFNGRSLTLLPQLKALMEEMPREPIRFIFISVDKRQSSWLQRLRAFETPGEHLVLPDEADYEFLRRAFIHNSLPALYLVRPNADIERMGTVNELRTELLRLAPRLPDRLMGSAPPDPMTSSIRDPSPTGQQDEELEFSMEDNGDAFPSPATDNGDAQPFLLHTVRKGETLYAISRQYNVEVAAIRAANDLQGNLISVGQKLRIPQ